MAYLQDLKVSCDRTPCGKTAVVQLKDWRNESRGRFCRAHGKRALADRQHFENANPHARAP
jgi:hypothetical protein